MTVGHIAVLVCVSLAKGRAATEYHVNQHIDGEALCGRRGTLREGNI